MVIPRDYKLIDICHRSFSCYFLETSGISLCYLAVGIKCQIKFMMCYHILPVYCGEIDLSILFQLTPWLLPHTLKSNIQTNNNTKI